MVVGLFKNEITNVLQKVKLESIENSASSSMLIQLKVKSLEPFSNYFNQEMNGSLNSHQSKNNIGQIIGNLMNERWPDEQFQLTTITINTTTDCPGEFSVDFKGSKYTIRIHACTAAVEQLGRHAGGAQVDVSVTENPSSSRCCCS